MHVFLKNSMGEIGLTMPLHDYLTTLSLKEMNSLAQKSKKISESQNNKFDYFEEFEKLYSLNHQDINLQGRIIN